jgi:hypothetical protein
MKAKKDNKKDGKPAYKYLSEQLLNETSRAMMAGALKYGEWNYLNGHLASDLLEAAMRHIVKALNGEDTDADCTQRLGMRVSHLGCAVANINMLLAQQSLGTLIDDLETPQERLDNESLDPLSLDAIHKIINDLQNLKFKESGNAKDPTGFYTDDEIL